MPSHHALALPVSARVESPIKTRTRPAIEQVAQELWDVIVVGAGVGGATAAREIAQRGARVLLVDRAAFPRYKVCGCCLNARATSLLRDAGFGDLLTTSEASPIHEFHLAAKGRNATVAVPPGSVALSRSVLDDALVEAAIEAGAVFLDETTAHMESASNDFHTLRVSTSQGEHRIRSKILIASDGLSQGILRELDDRPIAPQENSHIGAGVLLEDSSADYEDGTIHMACGAGGYVGLVRLGNGQLNIAAALNPKCVREKGGLSEAAHSIITEAGLSCPSSVADAQWRGTPPLTRRAPAVSGHRFFVIGDAAGYVEPFTGEGMASALSSATAVARIALEGVHEFDTNLIDAWAKTHRQLTRRSHRRCRLIASALRRPRLVGMAVGILGLAPQLAAPVIKRLNEATHFERKC